MRHCHFIVPALSRKHRCPRCAAVDPDTVFLRTKDRKKGCAYDLVSGPLFHAQRRKESEQQPILFLCTRNFNCGRSVSVTLSVVVTLRSDRLA